MKDPPPHYPQTTQNHGTKKFQARRRQVSSLFSLLPCYVLSHYLNHRFVIYAHRLARSEAMWAGTYSSLYANSILKNALLPSGLSTVAVNSFPTAAPVTSTSSEVQVVAERSVVERTLTQARTLRGTKLN